MRQVHKIICLIKAISEDGTPLLLNFHSLDWKMLHFLNVKLAENKEDDIRQIKEKIAARLNVLHEAIEVRFDRTDKRMRTVTVKETRDEAKIAQYGKDAKFYHYFAVIKIKFPPQHILRKSFCVDNIRYQWITLAELKSDPLVRKYNLDVVGFISDKFDATLVDLEIAFNDYIIDKDLIFVISSFAESMEPAFSGIKAAGEACGCRVERVMDVVGDYRITDKILDMIRRSIIIVADLTHERPNVYFELGYARGFNKTVVTIAKVNTNLHFDVKDWTCLFYDDSRTLERHLAKRLQHELDNVNYAMKNNNNANYLIHINSNINSITSPDTGL